MINPTLDKCQIGNSCNLLVVTDQPTEQALYRQILGSYQYSLTFATSGDSALRRLDLKFDLILIDLVLPDISGITLLELILEKTTRTLIIAISGHESLQLPVMALKRGAFWYLKKPLHKQELIEAVERARSFLEITRTVQALWNALQMVLNDQNQRKISNTELLTTCAKVLFELTDGGNVAPETISKEVIQERLPQRSLKLRDIERKGILEALLLSGGNKARAARLLGISEKSIYNKIVRLKLQDFIPKNSFLISEKRKAR